MTDRFKLQPTGAMTVIVEMAEYGPIEIKVVDVDMVLAVVGLLAKAGSMTVDSYTARHRKTLERLLPEKED